MKLSRLVFECVKDSITLPNMNVEYDAFLDGEYDCDDDYKIQIVSVFSSINLAIARLQTNNKISFDTEEVSVTNNSFEFTDGDIINIVNPSTLERYEFRTLSIGKKYLIIDNAPNLVLVEYKKKIPHFSKENLKSTKLDENGNYLDENIELEEYGITDVMCEYIKMFVKAVITEYIDPYMANNFNNRAEQYFDSLKRYGTSFNQCKVKDRLRGLI